MADNMSKEQRSFTMSRIRSNNNNSTELKLLDILLQHNISGWERDSNIIGKPDFVFFEKQIAIFIDGCFWHGCPKCFNMPKSNEEYWSVKITQNKKRARFVNSELKRNGWKVIRIWEHSFKRPSFILKKIIKALEGGGAKMNRKNWSDKELTTAVYLYRFGHEELGLTYLKIAQIFGRSPESIFMKLSNLLSLDQGFGGLSNTGKRDKEILESFKTMHKDDLRKIVIGYLFEMAMEPTREQQ